MANPVDLEPQAKAVVVLGVRTADKSIQPVNGLGS
jgi:hypothetical protein